MYTFDTCLKTNYPSATLTRSRGTRMSQLPATTCLLAYVHARLLVRVLACLPAWLHACLPAGVPGEPAGVGVTACPFKATE